jgi:acetyltransferase-like isoleucine patch superfamily enzyme
MKNKKPQPKDIVIGKHSYIPKNYTIMNYGKPSIIHIGNFCSIAGGIIFFTGGNHKPFWVSTFPFSAFKNSFPNTGPVQNCTFSKGAITIENDVWIGFDVTIMSGVTIENGAVIGTKSVVASNIPPYSIAIGNPCKVIKKRFSDEIIKELLEIQWWNWPVEKIKEYAVLLESENILEFIKAAKN